jgi:hypothetical protein
MATNSATHYANDNHVVSEINTPWRWLLARNMRMARMLEHNQELSAALMKVLRGVDLYAHEHGISDPSRTSKIKADVQFGHGTEELRITVRLSDR